MRPPLTVARVSADTDNQLLREQLEGFHTSKRLAELYLSPVGGKFDAAHLREINRRIFQDLPAAGFPEVTPGEYRKPVPAGQDWIKNRSLEGMPVGSHVAYSTMDKASIARLDKTLAGIDVDQLSKLKTGPFVQAIGKLYTELDYLHPFPDGNSRTLREFTRELAEACGYNIDWTRFARSAGGRNVLYIARDLSVNELAEPMLRSDKTRQLVMFSSDQLDGNRKLPDLLRDAVLPGRAIAFRSLPEPEARVTFAELAPAYGTLNKANAYAITKFSDSREKQRDFIDGVRANIQKGLDAGETTQFATRPQKAAPEQKTTIIKERER